MVVTQRDDVADRIRELRSHGMSSLTWDRYRGQQLSYDVSAAGFNFRADDLRAALLRVQLSSLDNNNSARRERVRWYREFLGSDTRWLIPFAGREEDSSCHLFVVVLEEGISRELVMKHLRTRGIQSSIHYPPVHQFSFYHKLALPSSDLRVTEEFGRRVLTLPLFPTMSRDQVAWTCEALHEAVELKEPSSDA